jgi:hypothetical protein
LLYGKQSYQSEDINFEFTRSNALEYRNLGKTGLKISRLGLGGIPIQKTDADLGNETALYDAKNKVILYKQGAEFGQLFPAVAKARAHAEMAKDAAHYRNDDHEFQARCAAYIFA